MSGMLSVDDLSFDILNEKIQYRQIDICGLVKKMESKKRKLFKISRETKQLDALIGNAPKKDECFKMLSVGGGFSSLGIIKYVADREVIEQMYVSTFRIGKNHFKVLKKLHDNGRLKNANFITSNSQKRMDETSDYDYYRTIELTCKKYGWGLKVFDNHSKLILIKTTENFYVVETSSNLNENPKMEQFSWENDKSLYEWYEELFIELMKV